MKPLLQSSGQAPVDIKHHRDIMLYFLKPSSGVFTENVWFRPGKKNDAYPDMSSLGWMICWIKEEDWRATWGCQINLLVCGTAPRQWMECWRLNLRKIPHPFCHPLTPSTLLYSSVKLYTNRWGLCSVCFLQNLKRATWGRMSFSVKLAV